jgi:hypothetical protein
VADRLQRTELASVLEKSVMEHLSIRICVVVINWSSDGPRKLEAAGRKLATEQTEDFMRMGEHSGDSLMPPMQVGKAP